MGLDMYLMKGSQETIYWRKMNAIHHWFVQNVQDGVDDCRKYKVPKKKLEELRVAIHFVLQHQEKAKEKLPTQSGFFFGSLEYNIDYFEELRRTLRELDILMSTKGNFYYQSSW